MGTLPPRQFFEESIVKGQKLHELQEKYTINGHCLVCGDGFQYPYGRWHVEGQLQSGTCSKKCEKVKADEMLSMFRGGSGLRDGNVQPAALLADVLEPLPI